MQSYLRRRFVQRELPLKSIHRNLDEDYIEEYFEAKNDKKKRKVFLRKLEEDFLKKLVKVKNPENFKLDKNDEKTLVDINNKILKREHIDFDFLKGYKPSKEFINKLHHYFILKYEKTYNKSVFEYRFGKIIIYQKFINYFKLRNNNSQKYNDQYIDYDLIEEGELEIFNDILFIQRNELFFKTSLLDCLIQFERQFPNLKYDIEFEVKSDAENLDRGHILYDCLVTIINKDNNIKAQIGIDFDETSHGKVNERDEVRNAVSKVNLFDYFYMREINKINTDYESIVINKLEEYYEFFQNVNKSIFDISVALLNDTKNLMMYIISDYYISFYRNRRIELDTSFSRTVINDFENYSPDNEEELWDIINSTLKSCEILFELKRNPNLLNFAELIKTRPEKIINDFDEYELEFNEDCKCEDNKLNEQECICRWNIKGNINELFNNYSGNSRHIKSVRSLKDDVIELINKSSEEIIKIMRKIIYEKQRFIPIQVAYYSRYYDPDNYMRILRTKFIDILKEKKISIQKRDEIIRELDTENINKRIFSL